MKFKLDNRYIKYFPKPKDITIIQMKKYDEIFEDIELLDYDLNYKKGYMIYKNVDIFSIEHPLGKEAACASGKIIDVIDFEFEHNVPTDKGSSGCPLILLNNNLNIIQVIGIHKEADNKKKLNYGTFIGEIFNENNNLKNIINDNDESENLSNIINVNNLSKILDKYYMEKENNNIIFKESISTKDFKEEGVYWSDIKNKSNNEEQSTLLRKDPAFGEKIYKKLKDLIKDEQIVDEKRLK